MFNSNNVIITDYTQNKSIVVPYTEYKRNEQLFNGAIGKKMINNLITNNVKFTLIEE